MAGRSPIERDAAAKRVADDALKSGATIAETQAALAAEGHEASMSAVGRYKKRAASWLEVKRQHDEILKAFADSGAGENAGGLLNFARTVALDLLTKSQETGAAADDVNKLVTALLNVERAEKLNADREERAAAAERKRLEEKARAELKRGGMKRAEVDDALRRIYGVGQ